MSTGLYPNYEVVERFSASAAPGNVAQSYISPYDADVVGLLVHVGTAPGGTNGLTVNVTDFPTSQQGGPGVNPNVATYNLWTATNVPTVSGVNLNSITPVFPPLVQNAPYPLTYPFPGPVGTQGFVTSQQTTLTTLGTAPGPGIAVPVLAPPTMYKYSMTNLVPPDNTYTDYNNQVGTPTSLVHMGDVLTFVLGGTAGAAANVQMELVLAKR